MYYVNVALQKMEIKICKTIVDVMPERSKDIKNMVVERGFLRGAARRGLA